MTRSILALDAVLLVAIVLFVPSAIEAAEAAIQAIVGVLVDTFYAWWRVLVLIAVILIAIAWVRRVWRSVPPAWPVSWQQFASSESLALRQWVTTHPFRAAYLAYVVVVIALTLPVPWLATLPGVPSASASPVVPVAAASPAAASPVAATGAESPAPSASTEGAKASNDSIGSLVSAAASSANGVLIPLAYALLTTFVLIPLVLYLLWAAVDRVRGLLRRQLVIANLTDATGDELKGAIDGLSQRLRQDVYERMNLYLDEMEDRRTRAPSASPQKPVHPVKFLAPTKEADAGVAALITALKDSAPDQAKQLLSLIAGLLPPRGLRVVGTFQLVGQPPQSVGLSTEISDLSVPSRTELRSLWTTRPEHDVPVPPVPKDKAGKETKDAHALAVIAAAFEKEGRWADAITKLEAALEKDPGYEYAQKGLARVLAQPSVRRRAEQFLHGAVARWLAILLVRAGYLGYEAADPEVTRDDRAKTHNWAGYRFGQLHADAPDLGLDESLLYEEAVTEFKRAIEERESWYLPYENLGDVLSYLGDREQNTARQREAIATYDKALEKAQGTDGYLKGATPTAEIQSANLAELKISKAVAQLLADQRTEAFKTIESALGARWAPSVTTNPDVLYTMACFCARAGLRERAVDCLAHCFAANPSLVSATVGDPDLDSIRDLVDGLRTEDWRTTSELDETKRGAAARQAAVSVLRIAALQSLLQLVGWDIP